MFNLKISSFFPKEKDQSLQRRFHYLEQITTTRRLPNIVYLIFATEKFRHLILCDTGFVETVGWTKKLLRNHNRKSKLIFFIKISFVHRKCLLSGCNHMKKDAIVISFAGKRTISGNYLKKTD